MFFRRIPAVLANGCAILLLGMVGIAVAAPVITIDGLNLFGPVSVSGLDVINTIWIQAGNAFDSMSVSMLSASSSLSIYVIPDTVSDALSIIRDSGETPFLNAGISQIAVIPASNSLFASVPEPIGLSVLVTGVAAISFVRRRFRRG